MPVKSAIWIDRLEKLEIDGDGVRIALNSDDFVIKLRMSRNQLRRFVECGRIALAEADGIDRHKIVEMRRRNGAH